MDNYGAVDVFVGTIIVVAHDRFVGKEDSSGIVQVFFEIDIGVSW